MELLAVLVAVALVAIVFALARDRSDGEPVAHMESKRRRTRDDG